MSMSDKHNNTFASKQYSKQEFIYFEQPILNIIILFLDVLTFIPFSNKHFSICLSECTSAMILVFTPLALVLFTVGEGDHSEPVALVRDECADVHLPRAVGERAVDHELIGPLPFEYVSVLPGLLAAALDLVVLELSAVFVSIGPRLDTGAYSKQLTTINQPSI